jgi:hypothetical protein
VEEKVGMPRAAINTKTATTIINSIRLKPGSVLQQQNCLLFVGM